VSLDAVWPAFAVIFLGGGEKKKRKKSDKLNEFHMSLINRLSLRVLKRKKKKGTADIARFAKKAARANRLGRGKEGESC